MFCTDFRTNCSFYLKHHQLVFITEVRAFAVQYVLIPYKNILFHLKRVNSCVIGCYYYCYFLLFLAWEEKCQRGWQCYGVWTVDRVNRCWLWVENKWNHIVSKSQAPLCEIICKQESMITTTIFTAFLWTLNSFTALQCRNNYIVVGGQLCHLSARYLIFMTCMNYIWSKNRPSVLKFYL